MKFSIELLVLLCAAIIGMVAFEAEAQFGITLPRCKTVLERCNHCCQSEGLEYTYGKVGFDLLQDRVCLCYDRQPTSSGYADSFRHSNNGPNDMVAACQNGDNLYESPKCSDCCRAQGEPWKSGRVDITINGVRQCKCSDVSEWNARSNPWGR